MGYAPAVLAGIILLTQKKYLLGFIAILVFSTSMFYQNHVQIVYYTLLIAICIGVAFAIQAIRNKEIVHLFKTGGLALAAGMMGLLSFAVILFPTYDYTKETMRGGRSELSSATNPANKSRGGLNKDYAFGYSYGITEVLTVVVPRMFGGSSSEIQPGSKTASTLIEKFGMNEEQADQYAQGVPSYWGPQGMTSGAVYFGAVIGVLFIFGLVFYKGWHSHWIIAVTILGVFLAWGKHFDTFNYFVFDHLPFYNKFRAPSMAMVIPQLTFPLLAALGLDQLLNKFPDKNILWKKFRIASIATGVLAAVLTLLYFTLDYKSGSDEMVSNQWSSIMLQQISRQEQPTPEMTQQSEEFGKSVISSVREDRRSMYGSDLIRSLIFMALSAGLLYGYMKGRINKNLVTLVLTALIFIDLITIDLRYLSSANYMEKDQFQEAFIPTEADLQVKQDTSFYRVFNNSDGDPFQLSGATSRTSYFHNSVGGYHPAKLALYQDLIAGQLTKGNLLVFNMLNTKYFIVNNPSTNKPVVQQNPNALGPVWFVRAVSFVDNADQEMKALDNLNTRDSAVADKREKEKIKIPAQGDSSAKIQLVKNIYDKIIYKSSSSTDQFAVFSEIYYPNGWKATIDGKETPIAKVNYLLRGLSVPAGNHTIEFVFLPKAYVWGDNISLAIGILSILILIYGAFQLWKNYQQNKLVVHGNKTN